ncbi:MULTISPECIES: metal-dependent transcriptional regulator [Kocuria]|uniref:metal-dependent transcriptional regulator n=1 Tax=Kocuria TaxID=57493 RepID=UPI000660A0F7|nr:MULTISPECIES: metal-dependent transcriptional regulator [Kocuria]MCT1367456.1 metal-dependent transcriptional regulator [Rothia sp. p3-SID1597]RUQ22534.1 metal-dependent transcriptional regulator [Kocuria sp. HSID16901]
MSVSQLTDSTQNYLKTIWSLNEWSDSPVTASAIAQTTGLRLSSVSDAVRKLTSQGLLTHAPYGAVTLTDEGRSHAVAMVRRHRLLETFLVETLGYTWDQVHDEAEELEHAVSDFMIDRIDEVLGHPERDPHGDPIPGRDGTISTPEAHRLTDTEPGRPVTIERISDADPQLLQYFSAKGLTVGVRVEISPGAPYSGGLEVHIAGSEDSLSLGREATDSVFVSA